MAEPVRARRLSDEEGRRLLQIVRRGKHGSVRVRRAMIIMASASGTHPRTRGPGEEPAQAGQPGRPHPPAFDPAAYKQRNVVERAFCQLRQHRAVATRYDKRDFVWRGTIDVASIRIWLRHPVS